MPKLRVGSSRSESEPAIVLSFRLPVALIQRIDRLAEREIRNRVNMVHVLLLEAVTHREQKQEQEQEHESHDQSHDQNQAAQKQAVAEVRDATGERLEEKQESGRRIRGRLGDAAYAARTANRAKLAQTSGLTRT
jgi:hypothetical protein